MTKTHKCEPTELRKIRINEMENHVSDIISYIGDTPEREGLLKTPHRVVRTWRELFAGYQESPESILSTHFHREKYDEMIILKKQEFYSICEHHMLPFFGEIHIGYTPLNKIVGISKLARLTEIYARRLQIQERLTCQIADDVCTYLEPKGVMVVCSAQHFCMTSRGVKKQHSIMTTSAIRGIFKEPQVRQEFLELIKI